MALIHRYIEELNRLEAEQMFCGEKINPNSKVLFIGTFNPDDNGYAMNNNAVWFYGRTQSKFWRYMPIALGGQSLHINDLAADAQLNRLNRWRGYCLDHKLVIIDLVKSIKTDDILESFSDREVNEKISLDLTNVEIFDVSSAFKGVTFERVVYSLLWTDQQVTRLRAIRDIVNKQLIEIGCIQNPNQIKYCKTPSRNDAQGSWTEGING
jgi:hypothetical protein